MIRTLFNHCRSYIFLYLCPIVLLNILPLPYLGIGTGYTAARFSITSNNEPLYKTLVKVSKITGYQIEITKGWKDKPLTADLKKVTLEESMKSIIRAMGRPNHAMIVDERRKKVEIRIFDASSTGQTGVRDVDVVADSDFSGKKNMPPSKPDDRESVVERERMEAGMERERKHESVSDIMGIPPL